jgi:ribonucleoside-diphosphate reductase alpha chain
VTKFEDVKDQTTSDYFSGNKFSIDVFEKKYTGFTGETYVQAIKRVCDYIASVEKTDVLKRYWSDRWFDEIYNDWWHPAGSIMQGAIKNRRISLINCTTSSLGIIDKNREYDSLESIIRNLAYKVAKYAAYRQGNGMDFSRLRPRDSKLLNSANKSTGAVHWMGFIDNVSYYVGQFGRIPALLFSLNIHHPDIVEFIKAKSDTKSIQNANISVQVTDDFYKAVDNDEYWVMTFTVPARKVGERVYVEPNTALPNYSYDEELKSHYYLETKNREEEVIAKKEKARYILELIAKGMCDYAEPGIQNIDVARKYSNSDYVYDKDHRHDSRIVSSNACSEQYLSADSCCVLASLNVEKFSTDETECNNELSLIGESINRFLDNVNEAEIQYHTYATEDQREAMVALRRTGAGVTNICGWLLKGNVEYGSKESVEKLSWFMRQYNYYMYKSSIALGKEKGNFGLFNREKLEKSPFIQRMMGLGLIFDSLRNITCSSVAPTGSMSNMFRGCVMSYGIEPSFGMYYWKRTRISGKYEYYFCVPKVVKDTLESLGFKPTWKSDTIKDTWDGKHGRPIAEFIDTAVKKSGIKFRKDTDISCFDKLELMAEVAKWVDSSISVTYMLPEGSKWQDVYDFILLAHKKELKSIAAFPDKKMYGIVSCVDFKSLATKLMNEGVNIHPQNFDKEELDELQKMCNVPTVSDSIERPKVVNCDVHHIKVRQAGVTSDWFVLVGMVNNKPYEVFAGPNGNVGKAVKHGKVTRIKSGKYACEFDDRTVFDDIDKYCSNEEETITRLVSMSLRLDAEIDTIVDQLEKVKSEDLLAFSKAIARALKKYIPDGKKVVGQTCPTCGNTNLVRSEGCVTCTSCGYSKCS